MQVMCQASAPKKQSLRRAFPDGRSAEGGLSGAGQAYQGEGRTEQDVALSVQSCLIPREALGCGMHQRVAASETKGLSCHLTLPAVCARSPGLLQPRRCPSAKGSALGCEHLDVSYQQPTPQHLEHDTQPGEGGRDGHSWHLLNCRRSRRWCQACVPCHTCCVRAQRPVLHEGLHAQCSERARGGRGRPLSVTKSDPAPKIVPHEGRGAQTPP